LVYIYNQPKIGFEDKGKSDLIMLLNKKCIYLGVSLFSAMILTALPSQTTKADSTSNSSGATSSVTGTAASTATAPVVSTSSTSVAAPVTTSSSSSSTVAPVTSSSTSSTTAPVTSSSTSSTAAPVTSSSTSSTPAPATSSSTSSTTAPATSSSTSSTTTPATSTTSTSSTSSTSSSSTTGIGFVTQPATSATAPSTSTSSTTTGTGTSTTPTTGTTTTGTTTSPSYAIPSDITNSTVVNFTDPLLGNAVKYFLNVPAADNITVGAIKGYINPSINIAMSTYQLQHPNGPDSSAVPGSSMSDQQDTPIESLNGMQYLSLLPAKTTVGLQVMLGTDASANNDLTPLDNLNLASLTLDGNYSDPNAKEIDLSQVTKLNTNNISYIEFSGDTKLSPNSGLNNQQLAEIAPTLTSIVNNSQASHMIELGQSDISDFSPLKSTISGKGLTIVAATNIVTDPTPIYAVDGQPISFTAPKMLDINGNDIANSYHFTYTVPQSALADDNLTNLGNDNYQLTDATPGAKTLTYGNLGWAYSANPDSYINETTANGTTFEAIMTVVQPLVWQTSPNVTINYLDQSGKPILAKGVPLVKTLDGVKIGDSYDLTADSQVAGYKLTSLPTILKGAYTQDPQVVNLVYSKIPIPSSSSSAPTVTTPTAPTTSVTPKSSFAVQITDISGNPTGENAILADMGVKATAQIRGQLYYQVGYGQWVPASSYTPTKSDTAGVVRTFDSNTALVDAYGKPIKSNLAPNTEWKYSRIVTIDGADYYQVATDEYLPVKSSVAFTPVTAKTNVSVTSKAVLYNSQGVALRTSLPKGSAWVTDGCAIINGVKMYRIATDEWISADSSDAYQPVAINYRTPAVTALYNSNGEPISRTLPAGSSWRVDRVVTINGKQYCRVATNEYIAKP